ncbi:hypothetical protein AUJ27_02045 [Candidatus Falkowbacteria bacterium CG1_02_37_44]|uniref:Uncharacterized protein n=1 Tax=Candidatus Falkowbacteria bacterium CG1_02_37_44 TaxID=1805146 RepID=A0A1J4TB08_9BACT|nr:MAG: hypothetical protein AUJ27_02045 [Candidatus Falkowbacteria bacterium CG1_02_37_44]
MLPLECLFEGRKFLEQFSGCFAFDILGDLAYGNLRRNRDKNVDMIFGNMPFDYLDVVSLTYFPDQIPCSVSYPADQNGLSVFRRPDQVEFQVKNGM